MPFDTASKQQNRRFLFSCKLEPANKAGKEHPKECLQTRLDKELAAKWIDDALAPIPADFEGQLLAVKVRAYEERNIRIQNFQRPLDRL